MPVESITRVATGTPNPRQYNSRATGLRSLVAAAVKFTNSTRSHGPDFWKDAAEGCQEAWDWMHESDDAMKRTLCDIIGFSMPELAELRDKCAAKQQDSEDSAELFDWDELSEDRKRQTERHANAERAALSSNSRCFKRVGGGGKFS